MEEAEREGRIQIDRVRNQVIDGWGMEFELDETGYNNLANPLRGLEDSPELLDHYQGPKIPETQEGFDALFRSAEKDLKEFSGDFLVMISGYCGIWEKAYNLVELEDFFCLLMSEPDLACEVMDHACDYKVAIARENGGLSFQ